MFRNAQRNVNKYNNEDTTVLRSRRISLLLDFALPVLILALGTCLIRWFGLDILLESKFFSASAGWWGKHVPLFDHIYRYGTLPAMVTSFTGLAVLIISFFRKQAIAWRRIGLFLVCVMLLGPGLLVNVVLKDHWGRPRPRDVSEFKGKYAFEEPLEIDASSPGNSFPSGHASMGFYFFTLYFLVRQRNKLFACLLFLYALSYGTLMGIMRMAQGGHFASDVLWSGGLVYIICAALYYLFKLDRLRHPDNTGSQKREVV